jgi:DMSO/TMAO reductase YedYZ molybdopterin-dependent catalytic subunit
MWPRFCFALASALWAQEAPTVKVEGALAHPLALTAEELRQMPRASLKSSRDGLETTYEGVWLHEVLRRAGVPQGKALRGKALAGYVLAEAQDGYQVLFSLDPTFMQSDILLADTANGKPLFGADGRFRLIAPKDAPGARSVRMLVKLEVVQLRK